jgi:GH15 family glucan-1,4-alpha-glucosidase
MGAPPIEDHGVIGDLHTAALVSLAGSIDFMCLPRFDSPTVFAALLDREKGGFFQIAPAVDGLKYRQRYLPDTNILLTQFLGEDGVAVVSDFMPLHEQGHPQRLVRRVKVTRGNMRFRMICAPRFDYGKSGHTVERKSGGRFTFVPDHKVQPALNLRCGVPTRVENGVARSEFSLRSGQSVSFVLETATAGEDSSPIDPASLSEAFKDTMNYWLAWNGHSQYRGRWREMVNRSALALKLLTFASEGSIVAAPTFGLPETIGGERNWDYRYTWIRDTSFTMNALMRLGYTEEASAFMGWIERRCAKLRPGKPLQVMYRIDGNHDLHEKILDHFDGFRKSRPVRIGNAASRQLQLDIYGELLESVHIFEKHGGPISYDFWMNLAKLIEWVCGNWRKPDEGIWEVRGGRRHFLYAKVLCWVALDRGIKVALRRSFPAPLARWHRIRDEIYVDIYKHYWNPKLKSFVQYRGAKTVDASALLMPMVNIICSSDPRWISTLAGIERTLVEDSLVYRYLRSKAAPDGLHGCEGTFSMCSFWYVECLALRGDLKLARFIFEKALGNANHLGLYAEQLGPSGEHLGNFPQALSHIALISAAWTLDERLSGAPG